MVQKMQICINAEETITGFNYAFTAALLQKLKKLYPQIGEEGYEGSDGASRITDMAASVISYLSQQTNFRMQELDGVQGGSYVKYNDLCDLITHTEEFLNIFK